MGDRMLQEIKPYTYLGVLVNSHLKDNNHTSDHIGSKANKLEFEILANYSNINKVEFGNTLWQKASSQFLGTLQDIEKIDGLIINDVVTHNELVCK